MFGNIAFAMKYINKIYAQKYKHIEKLTRAEGSIEIVLNEETFIPRIHCTTKAMRFTLNCALGCWPSSKTFIQPSSPV